MPKDNENIPLLDVGPLTPSEPQGFAPEEMVRCEKCQRANPPTRVNCLYCAAPFAFNEKTASRQTPSLRPLEKWEQGYSNILLPAHPEAPNTPTHTPIQTPLDEAASLLRLSADDLKRIIESRTPLPLARAASLDEALLVERRLKDLGIPTLIVSDSDLRMEEFPPLRIRAAEIDEKGVLAYQIGGFDGLYVHWSAVTLLVQGRVVIKSVEVRERKVGRRDSQILDTSETYADEAVVDVYSQDLEANLRIAANSFDFSCLQTRKGLLANENFTRLIQMIAENAPLAASDDSYRSIRQALEPVWPSQRQTESRGWRRERPGKYTLGAVTEVSNETQFTRYSRLRHYLRCHPVSV